MGIPRRKQYLDTTSWMVPYGTLMMILMIFFVILYSFSRLGSKIQYERTIAGLQSSLSDKKTNVLKETEVASKLDTFIRENDLDKYAAVSINAQVVKIELTQEIVFDSGSVDLKPAAIHALSKLAEVISDIDNKIIVEGHSDNVPVSGKKYSSNWELSALRAFSVLKYLMDKGIAPERLAAYGYGEFKPVADNSTAEGRAKNRRIEISIQREK